MADYVHIAKWVIRNVAARNGAQITFAPKIDEGDAGSGMHFHVELRRDGRNVMTDNKGELSTEALKLVGGMVAMSKSLTAFGNTVSCAYLRLVPHQEAPTRICWSESNRSALIRVPLGWRGLNNLAHQTNPQQKAFFESKHGRQTVELRSPDGSADSSLLLAGMTLAAYQGLTSKDSLKVAEQSHVTGNIFHDEKVLARLESLPESCWASAQALQKQRSLYEENDIFPPKLIDMAIKRLEEQNDKNLNAELRELSNKSRLERAREIMFRNIHVS
jgi:glutamine synthetase